MDFELAFSKVAVHLNQIANDPDLASLIDQKGSGAANEFRQDVRALRTACMRPAPSRNSVADNLDGLIPRATGDLAPFAERLRAARAEVGG